MPITTVDKQKIAPFFKGYQHAVASELEILPCLRWFRHSIKNPLSEPDKGTELTFVATLLL